MVKIEYDFREGLDRDHIIYKKKGYDCKFCCYYVLYLIATYAFTAGWYALFHYAYINDEPTAFWVYIAFWLAWVILIVTIAVANLMVHYRNKRARKAKEAEEEERKKREEEMAKPSANHGDGIKETNRNVATQENLIK